MTGVTVSSLPIDVPDKIAHATEYALLGFALIPALAGSLRRRSHGALLVSAIGVGILFGSADEFHQHFVPGRDSSVEDLAADVVGTALGATMALVLGRTSPESRA